MTDTKTAQLALPEQLISSVDFARTVRELDMLDESIRQSELRKPGTPTKLSRSSTTLEEFARLNKVTLTDDAQRSALLQHAKEMLKTAPRIHMSLATEPSGGFLKQMAIYLRSNINPVILLDIGLQPTIAAGCVVRTNNKMFDMSLRHRFTENRHMLADKIAEFSDEVVQESSTAAILKMSTAAAAAAAPAPDSAPAPAPEPTAAPVASTKAPAVSGPVQNGTQSVPDVSQAPPVQEMTTPTNDTTLEKAEKAPPVTKAEAPADEAEKAPAKAEEVKK